MKVNVTTSEGVVIVAPRGRIDHETADAFAAALKPHLERCKEGGAALVIDMSGVDYVSSVGLRALMLAAKQAEAQAGRIALAALTLAVGEVFEISRFDMVFKVHASVAEALAAAGARA